MVWKTIFGEDYLSSKVICFFFNIGMFPLEFDEDDPLAGLLSDEEESISLSSLGYKIQFHAKYIRISPR